MVWVESIRATNGEEASDHSCPNQEGWSYLPEFRKANLLFKEKQKENFDRGHRVWIQPEIPVGSEVVITTDHDQPVQGRVVQPASTPRSYIVETPSGEVRRNRSQLNVLPQPPAARAYPGSPETATPKQVNSTAEPVTEPANGQEDCPRDIPRVP